MKVNPLPHQLLKFLKKSKFWSNSKANSMKKLSKIPVTFCGTLKCNELILFIHSSHWSFTIPPENTRKPLVFWFFQGRKISNSMGYYWIFPNISILFISSSSMYMLKVKIQYLSFQLVPVRFIKLHSKYY